MNGGRRGRPRERAPAAALMKIRDRRRLQHRRRTHVRKKARARQLLCQHPGASLLVSHSRRENQSRDGKQKLEQLSPLGPPALLRAFGRPRSADIAPAPGKMGMPIDFAFEAKSR